MLRKSLTCINTKSAIMATENESIKNENTRNNEPKHSSVAGNIVEKIEDAVENMDTDFPLSGGVEHPVHHKHPHTEKEADKKEHPKKTSFPEDLETEFPLSGGEVER